MEKIIKKIRLKKYHTFLNPWDIVYLYYLSYILLFGNSSPSQIMMLDTFVYISSNQQRAVKIDKIILFLDQLY